MWSKSKDEPGSPQYQEPTRPSTPTYAASPGPTPAASVARPAAAAASIGANMRIKGEIHAREELLVDGEVEGVVESESLLTVGRNGKVKANIRAREVVIFGSVHGDVEVSGKIAIREQGSLIGNIKSAGISIDDGSYFKGSIDILRPDPKTAAKNEPRIVAQAS